MMTTHVRAAPSRGRAFEEDRMRWRGRSGSGNVEDRRGLGRGGLAVGGGIGGLILAALYVLMGGDLSQMPTFQDETSSAVQAPLDPAEEEKKQFVSVVLKDTEDVWNELFRRQGQDYQEPRMVLYTEAVSSACGYGASAMGPFYCPGDAQVYLDLSFFEDLDRRFGAPGDFAQAYVIAHEVGHHVQNLLGVHEQVASMQGRLSESERNELSVRIELQADYFAGVWAHHAQAAKQVLEPGDLEEALNAATAIGDDRLQRETSGRVTPDSFTHGTSEQRVRWFRKGFESGDPSQGDTFSADAL
jgi:predicted metalloprotease